MTAVVDSKLSLRDVVLLLQALIVIGGGFYFVGQLGAKIDHLASAIEKLEDSLVAQNTVIFSLQNRVTALEQEHLIDQRKGTNP